MVALSVKEVCERTTLSRTSIHRLEKTDPTFPRRRILTGRRVIYLAEDIDAWTAGRKLAPAPGATGRQGGPGRGHKKQ